MKRILLLALLFLSACANEAADVSPECTTEAQVVKLAGPQGCFVFELADGTQLEPLRLYYCGTPPLPKEVTEDPLLNFESVDGKMVRIGYQPLDYSGRCNADEVVKITCITELPAPIE